LPYFTAYYKAYFLLSLLLACQAPALPDPYCS
jgi:hypothetical protein